MIMIRTLTFKKIMNTQLSFKKDYCDSNMNPKLEAKSFNKRIQMILRALTITTNIKSTDAFIERRRSDE